MEKITDEAQEEKKFFQGQHNQVFILETKSQREGLKQVRVSANELVQSTALSTTLLETTRQVLRVPNAKYSEFADFLLRGKPPTIRQLETTGNGLDRVCAKQSSQVVFINEAADGKTNFTMDKLLTIFNREGVVKAQKSNDLSTRVVKIKAALAFT